MAKSKDSHEITPGCTISVEPGKAAKKRYKAGKGYVEMLGNPGEDLFKDILGMMIMQAFYDKWDEDGKVTDGPIELDGDTVTLLAQVLEPENLNRYWELINKRAKEENGKH